ncbi:helicase-like protein [Lacinutrix venerupis]|uniref:DEAD/DEAH box helicase family protein n=1 Tax=Lacinutrix venerupis TaxID=1486034 RepID=UPI000EB00051|nr:DEAD/DEAH box helicase family protein [Lacinutrix venerupis]RLJ63407.1 helicase-like protein [Lacinutrix venerupis]
MIESLDALKFIFPWRSYQAKLLKHFESHMADNHFHVIAPPGSGKTILGIEIFKRLGKKTLVLAPTLTIRNQWKDRLQTFFSENKKFNSFSFDIKAPSDVTFSTYQSLHAFYKTFEDKKDYYQFFKTYEIETLVLDEAHHLKNAWWTCLMDLKNNSDFYMVSLTATPPYDSSRAEVSKYFTLCGEVDDEIAVPDLVKEGDLCAHQDYVYFSKPEAVEINFIVEFRQKIADFKDQLLKDDNFINFLQNHRYYKNPNWHLDELYANTEYLSSIFITLNAYGLTINEKKLEILGFEKNEEIKFPNLELDWLEILFQNILVEDREQLFEHETYLKKLEKQLRLLHVFDKKKVDFVGKDLIYKSLANSPRKLKSIVSIINSESTYLKENLSCVILTDYIRKEFLTTKDITTINKIGVISIFQYVRCYCENNKSLAVLSGSIVIIHESVLECLFEIERREDFLIKPLEVDNSFVQITPNTSAKKSIVSSITKLFENGKIKVLVGTKSLLGEGWDAPSINSLILASFVGSFVSSNQMRGRAIRTNANMPNKTGNIWHLASIDPTQTDGGREVEILKRRFEVFVGVTENDIPFISNGFERLYFPDNILPEQIDGLNKHTLNQAKQRNNVIAKWENSIGSGTKLTRQLKLFHFGKMPFKKQKQIYYFDALRFFIAEIIIAFMLFYVEFVVYSFKLILQKGALYFIYSLLVALFLTFGYKLYKAFKLYLRYGFLYKKIKKMGQTVLDTLNDLKLLNTNINNVYVTSQIYGRGDVVCNLVGANALENSIFNKALTQLLEPINSPRYLIVKTNLFRKKLDVESFYSVPDVFGDKKENALLFQKNWRKYLGRNKLIYTRRFDGRKLLLKARLYNVYNAFTKKTKEVLVWK